MKKIIAVLFCLTLFLVLVSCGGNENQGGGGENPPVDNPEKPNDPSGGDEGKEDEKDPLPVDDELYVTIPEGRSLRVAQLADIHFGVEGRDWHNDKVDRTKLYISYIIETEKPDLIVCSGDNILSTGVNGITKFIEMMESYQVPWIWLYGNHDAENDATNYRKMDLSNTLVNTETKYLLYEPGYVETGYEDRYGNFSVKIYNESKEKLLGAFIIMDAGEYDYTKKEYKAITAGQIAWYKSEIDSLQEIYATQENNEYEIIPTIVFSHIQLPEFQTAYEKALYNDGAEFIIEQPLSESDIVGIGDGGPKTNTGFYSALVEKQSTKAYFVGHAHTLYFQVKMDGIVLGFGPQTGFSKLFENNEDPRKTYIYNINSDLSFTTDCCREVVKNRGLIYTTSDKVGHANYIADTGEYTFTISMKLYNRVTLDYYGDELTETFNRITVNNCTVTGEFNTTPGADWTTKLYYEDPDSGLFYCASKETKIYKFTYNPANNTLDIKIVEKQQLSAGQMEVLGVNKNSNLSVWKKDGFNVKSDKSWCSSTAKLFIVVDNEGRVVYAVYNPAKGYGEPQSNSYYTHPFYETDRNYTTNPAIVMTESGYKVVIPEGGFAITAAGESLIKLVNLILDPSIENTNDILYLILDRNSFDFGLRISYDSENKILTTNFTE